MISQVALDSIITNTESLSISVSTTDSNQSRAKSAKEDNFDIPNSVEHPINPQNRATHEGAITHERPKMFHHMSFSPFTSPMSSPAVNRRRQFKESQRISIENWGEHIQLNQYRLKQRIGQGSYGIVELAYNQDDEKNYVSITATSYQVRRKQCIA